MKTATILILGGTGETGRRVARHLRDRTSARLIVAARHGDQAQVLADTLNGQGGEGRVRAMAVDATDAKALRRALAHVDLIVNTTALFDHAEVLAGVTLDAGADWLDVQFSPKQASVLEAMADRIRAAGRCFVTQGGFHPGLPAAMVRLAANRLDAVRTAWVAGVVRPQHGFLYTSGIGELIELFVDYRAHLYRDGAWQEVTGSGEGDCRTVEFDFGFGPLRCWPMDFDEMRALPEMIPGLACTGFHIAGFNAVADFVVAPLIMVILKVIPRASPRALGRLLCWSTRAFGRPPYGTALQIDVEGTRDDQGVAMRLSLFHDDEYELTAIPVVAMIEQLLDGAVRRPGLHRMGHLLDPERAMAAMETMGVQVRQTLRTSETE